MAIQSKVQSGHVLAALATIEASGLPRPYNHTDEQMRVLAGLWTDALKPFCVEALQRATPIIIATNKKWPTVAEVVELVRGCEQSMREEMQFAYRRVTWKRHPMRTAPSGEITYKLAAALRRHPIWEEWLDAIHPAHENNWFITATCEDTSPWHIIVATEFEQEKIEVQFEGRLNKLFENSGERFRVENRRTLARKNTR